MNSTQEPYPFDDLERNEGSCQVLLLWKLVFGGHPPLKTSPATVPYTAAYPPDTSLWHYISDQWKQLVHTRENHTKKVRTMLQTLPENQICVDDDTIFYNYHARLYTCDFLPSKKDPKLIRGLSPDFESLQYDKAKEKIVHRQCSKNEEARLKSAIHSWASANGWRIEECDPEDI